jgi:hypothetical protein
MLALDLIDALQESVELFVERRHRVAFRLFRDVVETMDLMRVLHAGNDRSKKALSMWYDDQTISHFESRKYIEESDGIEAAFKRRDYYVQLSKFTHRTYRALLKSFSLGRNDMLVHDSHSMSILVLPETIASGMAVLADLIIQATKCLAHCGPLESEEIDNSWLVSLEVSTIPRRFAPIFGSSKYE